MTLTTLTTLENKFLIRFSFYCATCICLTYKFIDKFILNFQTFTPFLFGILFLGLVLAFYYSRRFFELIFSLVFSKKFENFLLKVRKVIPFKKAIILSCVSVLYIIVEPYYFEIQSRNTPDILLLKLFLVIIAVYRILTLISLGFYTLFTSDLFNQWSKSAYFISLSKKLDMPTNPGSTFANSFPFDNPAVLIPTASAALGVVWQQGQKTKDDALNRISGTQVQLQGQATHATDEMVRSQQEQKERYDKLAQQSGGSPSTDIPNQTPSAAALLTEERTEGRVIESVGQPTLSLKHVGELEEMIERGNGLRKSIENTHVLQAGTERIISEIMSRPCEVERVASEYNLEANALLSTQRHETLAENGLAMDSVPHSIKEGFLFLFEFFK